MTMNETPVEDISIFDHEETIGNDDTIDDEEIVPNPFEDEFKKVSQQKEEKEKFNYFHRDFSKIKIIFDPPGNLLLKKTLLN